MAKEKIRVAIIGVGNCACALVQGVYFYQDTEEDQIIPGLMNPNLGGYQIRDIEFSAAIDFVQNRVGNNLEVLLSIELKLEIWDYPNSAGVMVDAIRCAR